MIVGIAGRKRSGKDTSAALLVSRLGFRRLAFADKLKEFAAHVVGVNIDSARLDEFKDELVFGGLDGPDWTGRDLFKNLGVAAREVFGDDFWVYQVLEKLRFPHEYCTRIPEIEYERQGHPDSIFPYKHVVVPDVRFWNELEALKRAGALIVRVNRADRVGAHEFDGGTKVVPDACCYMKRRPIGDPVGSHYICGLPHRSHPSHFSGDTHESETTLPDSGNCYDVVIESASADETAAKVLEFVRGKFHG